MCGIAGVMTMDGSAPPTSVLDGFERALAHRGPDGHGRYLNGDVGLIHNRLAIIDLATGDQPLFDGDGAALVANGEIYNHVELRQGLLADARFVTHSDCETILPLYRRFGLDCPVHLRGMYAFALHDPAARILVLARDPFGIKPMYYTEGPAGFAFASEPQALVAAGLVAAEVDRRAVGELLQLQFTTGADSIFKGIRRLLPGEALLVRAGRVVERRRIPGLPAGRPVATTEPAALAELDRVLIDSVLVHQRSDVPYGLFLSSGIDSTAILAIMARLNDSPVRAYTACFPKSGVHDEFAQAERMARQFGARHVKVEVTAADFFRFLPQIVASVDDPTADYAIVPTWLLAHRAAQEVKVILCGEGGDELFAGYGRYRRQIRPWWLGGRNRRSGGPLSDSGLLPAALSDWRDGLAAAERSFAGADWSRLQKAQALDCADWLPHGLLVKLDRCLMAHGLEGRTPLLDPLVAQLAFRLPQTLQLRQRKGKYLLRRWLDDRVPEAQAFARKKGFTVPVGEWILQQGRRLGPLVANDPAIAALFDGQAVMGVFTGGGKHHGQAAWRLLFYALWHRRHIRGGAVDGDVFQCLADR